LSQLEVQMRTYNSNCIAAFKDAGVMPDYVQIGNEITGGMLFPLGHVTGSSNTAWANLGKLMKAAVNGIKDAAGTTVPKIMIHIDRGGDWSTTQWYFDNVLNQQVPFDIIGESYYPFWHGSLDDLQNCLTNAAKRYNRPVMIAETDFPWSGTTNIYGIPPNTNGQVQYVVALAQIMKGIPGGKGAGIFWWGTEYQRLNGYNLAGFDQRSFFSSGSGGPMPAGNVLPVADAFGQLATPVVMTASLTGASVILTWPLSGAGMSLTTSTSLMPSAAWSSVPGSIQNTGTVFTLTQPLDDSQSRFYRLQSN
jgi:hypothetical protein